MSGPVWRFSKDASGLCGVCLKNRQGFFLEGSINDNTFEVERRVCGECYQRERRLLIFGDLKKREYAPAKAEKDLIRIEN